MIRTLSTRCKPCSRNSPSERIDLMFRHPKHHDHERKWSLVALAAESSERQSPSQDPDVGMVAKGRVIIRRVEAGGHERNDLADISATNLVLGPPKPTKQAGEWRIYICEVAAPIVPETITTISKRDLATRKHGGLRVTAWVEIGNTKSGVNPLKELWGSEPNVSLG